MLCCNFMFDMKLNQHVFQILRFEMTQSSNDKRNTRELFMRAGLKGTLCSPGSKKKNLQEFQRNQTKLKLRISSPWSSSFLGREATPNKGIPTASEKECGGHMAGRAGLRSNPWHSTVFSLPPPQTPFTSSHFFKENPRGDRIGVKGS